MDNVEKLDKIIGRAVVSFETANKVGEVSDLLIDPVSGELAGIAVKRPDGREALVSIIDVHGIGPDAVIVEGEQRMVPAATSPLRTVPRAKSELIRVNVITERGHLMGNVANLFLCNSRTPAFIYEVRSSLFDKLLGRAFYFAASMGCALSDDRSALVVTAEPSKMDHRVEAAAERLLGPIGSAGHPLNSVQVKVRTQRIEDRPT